MELVDLGPDCAAGRFIHAMGVDPDWRDPCPEPPAGGYVAADEANNQEVRIPLCHRHNQKLTEALEAYEAASRGQD